MKTVLNAADVYVQAFSIREQLNSDLHNCISKVKEIGFSGIEAMMVPFEKQGIMPLYLCSVEQLREYDKILSENEMHISSIHMNVGFGPVRIAVAKAAAFINRISKEFEIKHYIFSGMFSDDKSAEKWAIYLNRIAEMTKDSGAVIVYHNHDCELLPQVRGGMKVYPMDTFFKYADKAIKLQLDIGWALFAQDDLFFYERYKDRIVSIHCKDFYDSYQKYKNRDDIDDSMFAPIGEGNVHTRKIVSDFRFRCPEGWIVIDQDKFSDECYGQLKKGYENISSYVSENQEIILQKESEKIEADPARLSLMTFMFGFELKTGKISIPDMLDVAAENKARSVDLMNITEKDIPKYISALTDRNMSVKCYIANISFLKHGEEKIRKDLRKQSTIAKALGAEILMIVPYVLPTEIRYAEKIGRQEVRKKMISGFTKAVEEGSKMGLEVTFETTPHDELCLSSAEDCLYMLKHTAGLKLVYDTANMLPAGEESLSYYDTLKDYIVYVHLKDVILTRQKTHLWNETTKNGDVMNCCIWGKGVIPIRKIYSRMIRDGYKGDFAIEYVKPENVKTKQDYSAQLKSFLS